LNSKNLLYTVIRLIKIWETWLKKIVNLFAVSNDIYSLS
jgi:hypothetical protein